MADKETFIPIDRRKMILRTTLYGVLGIVFFFVFYYLGENQEWVSPTVFKVASIVVLFFFMVLAGTFAKNIRSKTAGLYVSRSGIDDQTSSISPGLVKWKDVTELAWGKSASANYLLVKVKKPTRFVENAKNNAIKRLLKQNLTIYKTPIVINVGILRTDIKELEGILKSFSGKLK